jgi:hypothetical protein
LSPADYQQLLDFAPESTESIAWQIAMRQLASKYLHFFSNAPDLPQETDLATIRQGLASRLLAWLRTLMPLRWRFFDTRSY